MAPSSDWKFHNLVYTHMVPKAFSTWISAC